MASGPPERCQPYIVLFRDRLGLSGVSVPSDDLYWELGQYGYPLPTNAIQDMGFCTMTPREVALLLELLRSRRGDRRDLPRVADTVLLDRPVPYATSMGPSTLREAFDSGVLENEAHLEALVIANPALLPEDLRPGNAAICRQVPLSPFKPAQMDRADICYYAESGIADGSLPDVVFELKLHAAGPRDVAQISRYIEWIHRVAPDEASASSVKGVLIAPSMARGVATSQHHAQVRVVVPDLPSR
jgi:hypothetical protein